MSRERNIKYGLKRNLFYSDSRLKARLGGKPKESYTLKWHTNKLKDPLALSRFLEARDAILSSGCYREEFKKGYIAYIDKYLYNRFILLPKGKHFWLAVKGANLKEEGIHSYSDGISTFFRVEHHITTERVRVIILKYTAQHEFLPAQTASHAA